MKALPSKAPRIAGVLCLALILGCSDDSEDNANGGSAGSSMGGSAGSGLGGASNAGGASGSGGSGGSAGSGGSGGAMAGASGSGMGGTNMAGGAGSGGSSMSEPDAGEPDAGEPDAGEPDQVTYTGTVQAILVANCSPCHSVDEEGGHNAASSYDDAVRVADDIIDEIASGGMPESGSGNQGCNRGDPGDPGCVSAEDFALIQQWVDDGTPE